MAGVVSSLGRSSERKSSESQPRSSTCLRSRLITTPSMGPFLNCLVSAVIMMGCFLSVRVR